MALATLATGLICILIGLPGNYLSYLLLKDRLRQRREQKWGIDSNPRSGIFLPIALVAVSVLALCGGIAILWLGHRSMRVAEAPHQLSEPQNAAPPKTPTPSSPRTENQEHPAPDKPKNPRHQSEPLPRTLPSAAGHGTQTVGGVDCTANSGNCAGINNGNQIVNQYGAQKLGMTDAQQAAIRNDMKPFAGLQFTVFRHDATPDSSAFADKLRDALTGAGMICARDTSGQQFNGDGSAVPSGMSLQIGSNSQRAAKALADAMSAAGLITKPISASMNNVRPDAFDITVAPNR